jgi:thioredoxin-like negative regulator of GroEL
MIELLLQAERALTSGMLDQAEHLYWQAIEADPRNSIAVVGLARVALERKDDRTAYEFARKALAVDPDNVAAQRLATRMAEVLRVRGELAAPEPKLPAPQAKLPADLPAPSSAVAPVDARPGLFRRLIRRR